LIQSLCRGDNFFYLCNPLRKEGGLGKTGILKLQGEEKTGAEKIKNILFGSLKKLLTFALPTERKGYKNLNGGGQEW